MQIPGQHRGQQIDGGFEKAFLTVAVDQRVEGGNHRGESLSLHLFHQIHGLVDLLRIAKSTHDHAKSVNVRGNTAPSHLAIDGQDYIRTIRTQQRAQKSVARFDRREEPEIPHPSKRLGGVSELLHVGVRLEQAIENAGRGIAEAIRVENRIE